MIWINATRLSSVREQTTVPSADAMIRELLEGHEVVLSTVRTALGKAQDAKDEASAGILASRLEVHDKVAWMLSAQVG